VTPCSDMVGYRRFEGPWYFHLQVVMPHDIVEYRRFGRLFFYLRIVTPRSDVVGYQRFGGSCCLHPQGNPHSHYRQNLTYNFNDLFPYTNSNNMNFRYRKVVKRSNLKVSHCNFNNKKCFTQTLQLCLLWSTCIAYSTCPPSIVHQLPPRGFML
jgi:hypothetical protein